MNYSAHYDRLISRSRGRKLEGYCERHHVLPKCMGGDNSTENIVALTAEEHYVAHQLLVKIHPDVSGLITAAVRMAKQCTGNKAYGWIRRKQSALRRGKVLSADHRAKMSASRKGRPLSPDHRAKFVLVNVGRKHSPEVVAALKKRMLGTKHSAETRAKMSASRSGKKKSPHSPEARAKISATLTGKKLSADHCKKLSAALSGKKRKPFTAEHRANLAKALKGKVRATGIRGTGPRIQKSPEWRAKIGASVRAAAQRRREQLCLG